MKNTIMKKQHLILMGFCMLITFLFVNVSVTKATAVEEDTILHIYDNADLLSTNEIDGLEKMCKDYGNEAGIDIVILTHNDSKAKDAEVYIEDFYDTKLYGNHTDSVILLVDMYNRDVCIESYGLAETYIHSNRGDVIIEEITPDLSGKQYYSAFESYIKQSAAYMKDDANLNYDHDYIYSEDPTVTNNSESLLVNPIFQLLLSLVIGGIVVGIMAYHSTGTMETGGSTYLDNNNSALIGKRDDYIRTQVTRVRKPTNNTTGGGGFNAGGFKGGMSGGGHSHSTSRGKF